MSGRRSLLVAYDVRDAKRLRKVHRTMCDHGDPLQFSVFRCNLTAMEKEELLQALRTIIHHGEDRILLADLGPTDGRAKRALSMLGRQQVPPGSGPSVI